MKIFRVTGFMLLLPLIVGIGAAQSSLLVSEIKIISDPEDARVRPFESIAIQIRAYGEIEDSEGKKEKVRLREGGASVKLSDDKGGWISKPFLFQGDDKEPFYQKESAGLAAIIFGQAQSRFALQDAVLFTASDREGSYTIEAELNGQKTTREVKVERGAPARQPAEKTRFNPEPASRDPYRKIAEHYAPKVAQETWFQPKADYLARFDLDGDWKGDNNWKNAAEGSSQAYVYYAAMETDTHWFLIYNFFHPRDYSDKCVAGTCHENDNEGMILTVAKDGSTFGKLQVMESLAHNNVYSYRNDRAVKKGLHNIDGDVELYDNSHPTVFIEAGGHGVYGAGEGHARYSLRDNNFEVGTGVTYVYKGVAERPQHPDARDVGYQLLPIYDHWWLRAHEGNGKKDRTFDAYYRYEPYGNRPRPKYSEIAGSFYGQENGANKAKPFWGWHDNRTRKKNVLAPGQWGLDPAYGVSQNLRMPGPFSLNYRFNPYLNIGTAAVSPTSEPISETVAPAAPTGPTPTAPVPSSGTSSVTNAAPTGTGGLPELPTFQGRRGSDFDAESREGQFDIRVRIDGVADVLVQGDQVSYQVVSDRPAVHESSEFTQPLPRATFSKFEVEKRGGRGTVTLFQPPGAGNDYTARVRVSDPQGGDDTYQIRLKWEVKELAPPVAPAPPAAPERSTTWNGSQSDAIRAGVFDRHPGGGRSRVGVSSGTTAPVTSSDTQTAPTAPTAPAAPALPVQETSSIPGIEVFSDKNRPQEYSLNETEGRFDFEGRVDATAIIRVRADRVFVESAGGRPAEVQQFEFSQPLPAARLSRIELRDKDGRGDITLLEQPWEGNGYLAVIQISDTKGDDAKYRFRLSWDR
ncbi:MAG: hypothetical protein O2968_03020 [Acidobacteria bacterium]|nr:hypothetical protein [Acidobacteriota bacterium]